MKKAMIFDLDGTLANTLPSIAYFGNRALERYGFSPIPQEQYRYLVGNGAKKLVERMLEENGALCAENYAKVAKCYNESYDADPLYLTAPYPGVQELLSSLKAKGIKLAVLSNKPHSTTVGVVERLFGTAVFDCVYGQREGIPLKPDPRPLLAVMEELGVAPKECVYVGDTATDMKTGKAAGAWTVGVLWGFRDEAELKANHADQIVKEPGALMVYLSDES